MTKIDNEFEIDVPPAQVWSSLLNVEAVAPCMPGATLLEVLDGSSWRGRLDVRLGPVSLAFEGTVTVVDQDEAARRITVHAQGREQRGKGAATADVTCSVEPTGDGPTAVRISTDITLSGAVAQLSRGLVPEISKKLTKEFADCLQASITAGGRT